ncbi:MAG TPA: DUF308 domain-containing protein [Stellaceae bacterium]|nr:DUF308 domain-containing protein [Stellaceae bacterium]
MSDSVTRFQEAVRRHWLAVLIEGIVLLVLGALAVVVPEIASLAVAIFLGWLLLIGGVVGLISTVMMRQAPGFTWSLISAILGIVAGGVLILWPGGAVISLTLLMILFFWIEGVVSILFALDHRRQLSGRWGWMLASGIIDLILGLIIIVGLPGSAAWAIGLLLGINMIFGGAALISMATAARAE